MRFLAILMVFCVILVGCHHGTYRSDNHGNVNTEIEAHADDLLLAAGADATGRHGVATAYATRRMADAQGGAMDAFSGSRDREWARLMIQRETAKPRDQQNMDVIAACTSMLVSTPREGARTSYATGGGGSYVITPAAVPGRTMAPEVSGQLGLDKTVLLVNNTNDNLWINFECGPVNRRVRLLVRGKITVMLRPGWYSIDARGDAGGHYRQPWTVRTCHTERYDGQEYDELIRIR
jgi:hypothetical protein